jgi:hypothetical protein
MAPSVRKFPQGGSFLVVALILALAGGVEARER